MVPYRLGFAVKVLAAGGIPGADARRWQSGPHLSRSIELLRAVFEHLAATDVSVYRLSSQVIPYGTHPDLPQFDFRRQLDEAAEDVAALGRRATELGLRLSTHPGQYTIINAEDPEITRKGLLGVEQDAALLDGLGQGAEGTVVIHVGGLYGDRATALDRWVAGWERLSDRARARVGLENDDRLFGVADVLELHRRTGVRVVFDAHHHRLHRDARSVTLADALAAAVATWPHGTRPKVHVSSPRTNLSEPPGASSAAGTAPRRSSRRGPPRTASPLPRLNDHADLVTPWDLAAVIVAAPRALDVMLEAKAKDLALAWLRRTTADLLPEVAAAEERRSRGALVGSAEMIARPEGTPRVDRPETDPDRG